MLIVSQRLWRPRQSSTTLGTTVRFDHVEYLEWFGSGLFEPKPVDPEYFGLTYKFPDGSQFYFGPHEYCLLTGFSFGNNESILEELRKNTDCVKFKESVIDTYINSELTVTELYDFINSSSQMLQDDEKLLWVYEIFPYFATLTKREVAIPRALGWSENNILSWPSILKILFQSFKPGSAFLQEDYCLRMMRRTKFGCSKDDDSPQQNIEFDKVSSLDDNEFIEDENFDMNNLNFKQQGFLNSLLDKENINANASNPNPNQIYNATSISNDQFQELLNSVQRILQNQNIQDTFYKGYLDREAKSFMKTTLQRQDEIYQTLLDISTNSKLETETEIEDVQGDLGKDVPNMSADDMRTPAMQSIQSEPSHINCWIHYLLLNRPEDATWTIMPSQFLLNTNGGNWQMDYGSGSYAPFSSIEYINTWLLANGSEAYNSYRLPPFVRVVPTFVPQQSGLLGDCGVWVCM
ncbi:hypothetical protein QVD17_30357 [Tagetes erecta]|uniref:Uncharacterized protein n=1 Tax=Tagetes erecta TaxID=13708 RepID=A0AAD8K1E1_TARER|nr:hypothetical protein QVD17_30357 [Tagetes erecta]